ncbi:MAG: helix-turn-helix domain-containing protein [Rhodocyclaceae bacterium]|nr:helix-turn-helix domain-containing protein [Rhodocyclaceae bacterium]
MTDLTTHTADDKHLTARREEMQLAIADVANRLLLSQQQVRALETGDVKAFYNQAFYAQAMKRYRALLGLPEDVPTQPEPPPSAAAPVAASLSSAAENPPQAPIAAADTAARASRRKRTAPSSAPTSAPIAAPATTSAPEPLPVGDDSATHKPTAALTHDTRVRRAVLPTVLLVSILLAGIYGVTHFDQFMALSGGSPSATPSTQASQQALTDAPPSAEESLAPVGPAPVESAAMPDPAPVVAAAPVTPLGPPEKTAKPRAEPAEAAAEAGPYHLEAQGPSWIFTRDSSGKETESTLRAGQTLSLPEDLAFLAVGDVNVVSFSVDGVEQNLAAFSKDGRVARLKQSDLERLRGAPLLR